MKPSEEVNLRPLWVRIVLAGYTDRDQAVGGKWFIGILGVCLILSTHIGGTQFFIGGALAFFALLTWLAIRWRDLSEDW